MFRLDFKPLQRYNSGGLKANNVIKLIVYMKNIRKIILFGLTFVSYLNKSKKISFNNADDRRFQIYG